MCKSLQLYPSANKNTLNNFLSSPGAMKRLRGLNQTTALWLVAYQANWTLEKSALTGYSSGNHGTITWSPSFDGLPCTPGRCPQRRVLTSTTPKAFELLAPMGSWTSTKIWELCPMPILPPKVRANTWKVLNRVYRTADRSCSPFPVCGRCGASDTLVHRFLECPRSHSVWTLALSLLSSHPHPYCFVEEFALDWFFMESGSKVPKGLRGLLFGVCLWVIHADFLEHLHQPVKTQALHPGVLLLRRLSWTLSQAKFAPALARRYSSLTASW